MLIITVIHIQTKHKLSLDRQRDTYNWSQNTHQMLCLTLCLVIIMWRFVVVVVVQLVVATWASKVCMTNLLVHSKTCLT